MSSSIQQKQKNVSFGDQGFNSQNGSGVATNQGYSQQRQGQFSAQQLNHMNNLQQNNFQQNLQYNQQHYQQQLPQHQNYQNQQQHQHMQQQQMNNLQQNSHSVSNQSQYDDQNEDEQIIQRRQFDDVGVEEQQNSEQISHGQVQDEDDEEEEEEDQEVYQCVKCGKYAEQALMMECKHILCLNCASYQYKMMLKSSQNDSSLELISSIDCENCGIPTPLPEQTIKVLLTIDSQQPLNQNSHHKNQENLPQIGNTHQQQAGYYQYQKNPQQFQQQQQDMQQYNTYQKVNPSNNSYNQQQQLRPGAYQPQQNPVLQNKQNFNNQNVQSASQVRNTLQDNQFHENLKASKQKRTSGDVGSMKQSTLDKSNDEPILYCFTCESSCFCLEDYLKGLHKNHNVKNVSKSYEELQEPIDDLRFKIKTRADLLIQDEQRLNKKKDELNQALISCKEQIKQSFDEVLQVLQQKQQELIQQAEECIEEKFSELDKGINKVNSNLNSIIETYFESERTVQNEIRAFNYYSENKTKILETIQQMDTNLFHTIRDKAQYEFSLDKNSLHSHINSIKSLKVEIFRLKGLDNPDPNRIETKFYQNETQEKSKKLLEQIMQQHANSTAQANSGQNASINGSLIENPIQQKLLNSQLLIQQSNVLSSPSKLLSNKKDSCVAEIFNNYRIQTQQAQNQSTTQQFSPGRYKVQMNSTLDASTRYHSPLNNVPSNTSRKIKLSPSGRDLNTMQSSQLSQTNTRRQSPSFKKFSISSESTKQAFSNILQSPSSIAKKYTPQYEKVSLQPKDSVFTKQNNTLSNVTNNQIRNSKNNILEKLDNFKRNMEGLRKQGQTDENNQNQPNNDYTQSTAEEKANIAVENRIRQLEEKLQTKFC